MRKLTWNASRLAGSGAGHLLAVTGDLGWLACVTSAQSKCGTVLGTATDPSGSVVPQAKRELLNTGTKAVRQTVSGDSIQLQNGRILTVDHNYTSKEPFTQQVVGVLYDI